MKSTTAIAFAVVRDGQKTDLLVHKRSTRSKGRICWIHRQKPHNECLAAREELRNLARVPSPESNE